jgi:hypothetical protein
MPELLATWNRARGVWEVPNTESLICGHSAPYSATWPPSGMTRGGSAYTLPTSAPHTRDSEFSSLLPTPTRHDGIGGAGTSTRREGGMNLRTAVSLLPTPMARDSKGDLDATKPRPPRANGRIRRAGDLGLGAVLTKLLPTPTASDAKSSGGNSTNDVTLTDAVVRTNFGASTNPRYADGQRFSGAPRPRRPRSDLEENTASPPDSSNG